MKTSSRHAGLVQQARDREARERRELGRLVEHGVAREQGRHEHVRADELGVVPRRDVGDDAEGLVGDALFHRPRLPPETCRGRSVFAVWARKKSRRGSTPFSSLRDWEMGFPTSEVRTCASFSVLATTSSRNFAIACEALLQRHPRPARLRGAGVLVLRPHGLRVVGCEGGRRPCRSPGSTTFMIGFTRGRHPAHAALRPSRASACRSSSRCSQAARNASRSGRPSSSVGSAGSMNSGCHCTPTHEAGALPADGLDHAVGLARSPRPRGLGPGP